MNEIKLLISRQGRVFEHLDDFEKRLGALEAVVELLARTLFEPGGTQLPPEAIEPVRRFAIALQSLPKAPEETTTLGRL